MVKIKPDQIDTYKQYQNILTEELTKLREDFLQLDCETAPVDEMLRMESAYSFLLREQEEIEASLCRATSCNCCL